MNKIKILIVEDEKIIALDLKQEFQKINCEVTDIVSNYQDTITSIEKDKPDLITMDIMLKGSSKDGIEIVQEINKIKNIPIIYITAQSSGDVMKKAFRTNPIGYIVKPYKTEELKTNIQLASYKINQTRKLIINKDYIPLGEEFYFDMKNKNLYFQDNLIKLGRKEKQFLVILIEANYDVVPFSTLEHALWQGEQKSTGALRTLVYRIKGKLGNNIIEVTYGYGYNLKPLENSKFIYNVDKTNHQPLNNTIITFDKDQPHADDIDSLDITDDIDTFAKLIAFNDLKPPLSIGLLGKWGSGKSFFMGKLENKINYLSNTDENIFCKNICQIKFNAWHYSDTNLWASLVSHIFKELDNYINRDNNTNNKISIYTELLNSQKEKLLEKESLCKLIKDELINNKKELLTVENSQLDYYNNLKKLELKNIRKKILKDKNIQDALFVINKKNFIKHGKEIESLIKVYNELKTTTGIYKKALTLFTKDDNFIWIIGILLVIFGVNLYFDSAILYITSLTTILYKGKDILKTYLHKIKPMTEMLKRTINLWDNKEKKLLKKRENTKNFIYKKIKIKDRKIKKLEKEITTEYNQLSKIEIEIEKIKSGEYLANFISDRSTSDDYQQHLGLVSVIREDFDKLKEHLKEIEDEKNHKIERIVLYIDDLDRCPEDKVIQVLEAIHLLLAFDLFVVVVGVDSRWMTSALVNKYNSLDYDKNNQATPYDYLEKIFQIPFEIKSLEPESKNNLINSLLKKDIENNIIENNIIEDDSSDDENIKDDTKKQTNNPEAEKQTNNEHTKLAFSQKEINFIQKLSRYIEDTPRTIKRFVNIYRIIKNHYKIKQLMMSNKEDYKLILIILCFTFKKSELLRNKEYEKFREIVDEETYLIFYNYKNKEIKNQYINFVLRFSFTNHE